MATMRGFLPERPTSPNKVLERNALSHTTKQFQFHGRNYLQQHGTEMGTKVAVAFANIFIAKIESKTQDRFLLNRWRGKDTLTLNAIRDKIESFI